MAGHSSTRTSDGVGDVAPIPIRDLTTGESVGGVLRLPSPADGSRQVATLRDAAAAALAHVLDRSWPHRRTLVLALPPALLRSPAAVTGLAAGVPDDLRVVVAADNADLLEDPTGVLSGMVAARRAGWGIAVDGVGQDPAVLSLLGVLEPDVIGLDGRVLRGEVDPVTRGRVLHAAAGIREAIGTALFCGDVQSAADVERAVGLGASIGTGAALDELDRARTSGSPRAVIAGVRAATRQRARTPFDLVDRSGMEVLRATKADLLALSVDIEVLARDAHVPAVLLATFQDRRHFGARTQLRYRSTARHAAMVGVLGDGLGAEPVDGVRGGHVPGTDPLADEWSVLVLSPYLSLALVARDLGDPAGDGVGRRFDYVVTQQRGVVMAAAGLLASRLERA